MSRNGILALLERWHSRLFVLGAVLLVGTASVALYDVLQGTEVRLPLGQVFVGAGWGCVLLGMLGLTPGILAERRLLGRACALVAAIGAFGYLFMGVVYGAAVGPIAMSSLEPLEPIFLLTILAGTLLAFPLFAVAGVLTGAYSRLVSGLLVLPPVIFVVNVATGTTPESIFGVVVALILVFGTTGYLLDDADSEGRGAQPAPGATAE